MSRRARFVLLAVAVAAVGVLLVVAFLGLPRFGDAWHPYRDHAVTAALARHTANVVSSVNFDLRALDTFGEETILLASVVGVATLLRAARRERRVRPIDRGRVLDSTRVLAYALLPITLVVGVDVVAHGAITPGGGFQGGVILATGIHLLYLGGHYRSLRLLRPIPVFEIAEAAGVVAFAALGIAGLALSGAFLANVIGTGTLGQLVSSGTVPLLSASVGLAVAGSIVVLLARFIDQTLVIRMTGERP
jgi:Multisubunit Na+/H+ antiporter, MnhB subunit